VLRGWALAIKADANGEPCQCAAPDYAGQRSHLCFRCGLYNSERKAEIRRAMGTPHAFEPAGLGGILSLFCEFCTYPKDHARHSPARLGSVAD
jgi:hypothetical protein